MIELDRHIEILLLDNDCVIVPDFGGFMAHHVSARRDERDGMFLPPLRTIGFNPKLTFNDSLLAQSYVECYDISYPEAVRRIADEVRELRQHIENDGSYELHDLGTLSLNEDGHYVFEPCEAGILTPTYYGLSGYEMNSLSEMRVKEDEAEPKEDIAHVADLDLKTDEDAEHPTAKIVSLWRTVAVACIAVVLFLLIPAPLANKKQMVQQSSIDTGLLQRILPHDEVEPSATAHLLPAKSASTTAVAPKAAAETAEQPAEEWNYAIVLASRVTLKNAKAYVSDLKGRGYDKAEVLHREKHTKVVYGHYASEKEAYSALRQLRSHQEFAEAWVMNVTKEK